MLPGAGQRPRCGPKPKRSPQTSRTGPKPCRDCAIWSRCVRGGGYRPRAPREALGHEQAGTRYAVVVQSDHLPLSTWLVAPTSTSARPATFRPEVEIAGRATLVLAEQTASIDPTRLGR